MRPSSSIIKKMNFKRRKINSIPENFSPLSTAYKSSTNINFPNSIRNSKKQNKSQFQLKYQSSFFDSLNNLNHSYRPKLLTPKYKINLKNTPIQKETLKLFDTNAMYTSILSKLENIMIKYKQDINKLYYILSNIDNFINMINQGDYSNIKTNIFKSNVPKTFILNDYNLENIDENKNNEILSPRNNNKVNLSNNNLFDGEQHESDINIYKRKVNKLLIKISQMENKFKIEKLKYLFCIGQYQKKLTDLEKKLNMDSIDKMPKNELKKFLCYPHYVKFDINEDINPKSVPMFNMRKKKCLSSTHDSRVNKKIYSKSDSFDYDLKNKDNNNNNINSFDLFELKKDNDNDNDNEKLILNDNEEEKIDEKIIDKEKEIFFEQVKNMIELGKIKFDSKTEALDKLFGNDKNFFISHPKLKYIKCLYDGNKMATWKLENQINSLPKQLSKLKILSKSQKNAIVVFPSFLNETMANLEKLRTNKNFRSIENKFEETFKIKLDKKLN